MVVYRKEQMKTFAYCSTAPIENSEYKTAQDSIIKKPLDSRISRHRIHIKLYYLDNWYIPLTSLECVLLNVEEWAESIATVMSWSLPFFVPHLMSSDS